MCEVKHLKYQKGGEASRVLRVADDRAVATYYKESRRRYFESQWSTYLGTRQHFMEQEMVNTASRKC